MLSIIIPVFNGEKYITDLYENFCRQKKTSLDTQLIFVDDGSSDGTAAELDALMSRKHLDIKVIHTENHGVSSARNCGISQADGEYIAFCDVDDNVSSDYLRKLKKYVDKEGFDVLVFKSDRVKQENFTLKKASGSDEVSNIAKTAVLNEFSDDPTTLGVYNLLIKRELLEKNEIEFPDGYKYYEDYYFILKVFASADTILKSRLVMYHYILREDSAMQKFTADRLSCLELFDELEPFIKQHCPDYDCRFKKTVKARIYWSVLWQAALAFSQDDFLLFAKKTNARGYLMKLADFPDKTVKISSGVFLKAPRSYYIAVNSIGKSKTHIKKMPVSDFDFEKAGV